MGLLDFLKKKKSAETPQINIDAQATFNVVEKPKKKRAKAGKRTRHSKSRKKKR